MQEINSFNKLSIAIKRKPVKLLISIFISYTVIWAILEPLIYFCQLTVLSGLTKFIIILIVSVIAGISKEYPKEEIEINMKNVNTKVKILFGDLFSKEGYKVISVNEFFDSELGDIVSPASLHGKFIKDVLGGQSKTFNQLVDESLLKESYTEIPRERGRIKKYPIGTTAVLNINDVKYFLVALSHTNIHTLKAEADVPELWEALSKLWDVVRINAGGYPVNITLIGGGLSQIRLPPKQLLEIILISILHKAKLNEITNEIRIILTEDKFVDIDLKSLKEEWS